MNLNEALQEQLKSESYKTSKDKLLKVIVGNSTDVLTCRTFIVEEIKDHLIKAYDRKYKVARMQGNLPVLVIKINSY